MHIVIPDDYQHVIRSLDCFSLLDGHQVSIYHDVQKSPNLLAQRFRDADALVLTRERTSIGAQLLAQLPRLKLISQTGKAGAHLDLDACTAQGIVVMEGRGSPIAPAELTWALMLNARRQLIPAIQGLYGGHWQTNLGERLYGQTLGIWGYGRIGQRLARYARAFDMPVLVWGSEASRGAALRDGHRAASCKQVFFSEVDVLSLNLRLTESTRHVVTLDDLLQMKPSALLVNTSRAELLAPGALLEALSTGRPGYAALDVLDDEPVLDEAHPLLNHPKILCTPHLGYVEKHGYELYFGEAFANVQAFFRGDPGQLVKPAPAQQRLPNPANK